MTYVSMYPRCPFSSPPGMPLHTHRQPESYRLRIRFKIRKTSRILPIIQNCLKFLKILFRAF